MFPLIRYPSEFDPFDSLLKFQNDYDLKVTQLFHSQVKNFVQLTIFCNHTDSMVVE